MLTKVDLHDKIGGENMKGIKKMVSTIYKAFPKPITGIYSVCKSRLLYQLVSERGRPDKPLLASPAINRPFKDEFDNEEEESK